MKKMIIIIGFMLTVVFPGVAYADESSSLVSSENSTFQKTFSELTPEEQSYFRSKGFNETDTFFTEAVVTLPENSDNVNTRALANVLILTGSTKSVSSTMGRTEYIISSSNSPMSKVSVNLRLGNVKTYNSTVNLLSSYAYGSGIYYTYTGARKYHGVKLTAQVTNTFGAGSVSCTAGGLTIGK